MKKLLKSSSLALCSHSREDIPAFVKAGLAFLKENGFDAADLGLHAYGLTRENWQERVESFQKSIEEVDIPVKVCHLPFFSGDVAVNPAYREMRDEKTHVAIDAAKALNIDYAVLHAATTTITMKKFDHQVEYDRVMDNLAPYAEHAAKVGLNIVVENMRLVPGIRQSHRYGQDADELVEIADALGIGICWDFGHANLAGFKQSEALAYVGKRLKVLHVNDNNGADDDHIAPFMGNVDWVDAMHGLALAEFDGCFNYEVGPRQIPAELRGDFAQYLVKAADKLMEYIV